MTHSLPQMRVVGKNQPARVRQAIATCRSPARWNLELMTNDAQEMARWKVNH
jgi:hypothetical protein